MISRLLPKFKSALLYLAFITLVLFLLSNFADKREMRNEYLKKEIEMKVFTESHNAGVDEKFWKQKDSLTRIIDWKISRLKNYSEGVGNVFFSVRKITECDTCYSRDPLKFEGQIRDKYFIALDGYTLKDDVSFFIEKDKYFIGYPVWDTIYPSGNRDGHIEIKESPVRYMIADPMSRPGGSVLLPVSEKTYNFWHIIVWIFTILIILFFIITFFVLPVLVLYSIAKGRPFTTRNIKRLDTIGLVLLAVPILPTLVSIIVEWFLRNKIPSEIYYPFLQSILDGRTFLIAGCIVLLIAYAFRKGYLLQQEQDLTV